MIQRRHRRHRQGIERASGSVRIAKLVLWIFVVLIVFKTAQFTLGFFGVGNAIRKTAAMLTIEDQGVVNVSVEEGTFKRAENNLKLYAGDTVVTSPNNFATLDFFDGTSVRLDESTQIRIGESQQGEQRSTIKIELEEGTVWLVSPTLDVFSGSIARSIVSPYISAVVPSKSEILFTPRSLSVFSADGLGLEIIVAGNDQKVVIGEGQQFTLPVGGEQTRDLYTLRNPLDPKQLQSEFAEESRVVFAKNVVKSESDIKDNTPDPTVSNTDLTVVAPENNIIVQGSTIEVSGRIGSSIDKVRINGYLSSINKEAGTFTQELTLADEDEVRIAIEAVDEKGVVVAETQRVLQRNRKPPEPPTIVSPATTGETYRTNSPRIEISGKAPEGAIGIIVNDYRLQLFKPGNTTWSYLASVDLRNFHAGENIFEVVAINRGGYRSEPASFTIVLEEGPEGVISQESPIEEESSSASSSPTATGEVDLKNNLPLMPGSTVIFGPSKKQPYETSQLEFLIEGNVPQEVHSVWVNGYKLQLFQQSKGFFNYIASVELHTLKRGRNTYEIVTRSDEGYILDKLEFVANLNVN